MPEEVSRRVQRFEKEVRQLSAEYVMMGLKVHLAGLPTVTRVQVSPDLRNAKVYVHFMGAEGHEDEDLEGLQSEAYRLQKHIHTKLRSRFCPKIKFYIDKSYDQVLKIEKILQGISSQNS